MLASFIGWEMARSLFSGVTSTYGGGVWRSLIGLLPLLTTSALPTAVFVVVGVVIAPGKGRRTCFVLFGLSLLFSGGGINTLLYQDGFPVFWLANVAGMVLGGIIGLLLSMRMNRAPKPVPSPESALGLAPGSGSTRTLDEA